jgi:hypothetical protein
LASQFQTKIKPKLNHESNQSFDKYFLGNQNSLAVKAIRYFKERTDKQSAMVKR